ncbi:MAG: M20/M25/M40 family metallo-hydrolase [Gemmataceae bacterium]|nr:M20/M25/M40 family metallo-hydrolase [Gemmataceae bacterium]
MKKSLAWLETNDANLVADLGKLVAIPSISTDGEHQKEIDQVAELTCEQMRHAGLTNIGVLRSGNSNPYSYGEWLGAPGKPTVFLYAHHDVQPINFTEDWKSDPWTLTERDGRFYARGAADDKGAITVQLGAIASWLRTTGALPVNVKMLVEGEEEVGSRNLQSFFQEHKERLQSDVIVVCDTGNIETGMPCITYSLRGIVGCIVEVQSATKPVHSGMAGGWLADAALALNVILSRLYWKNGKIPIPGFYDKVRKPTSKERRVFRKLPGDEASWRKDLGTLDGVGFALQKNVHPYEQTWRLPAITVIAQEASSIKGASNQVLPKASAFVSCRIVPDQEPEEVLEQLRAVLTKDPPWGVKVNVKLVGDVKWWMTDPQGPAFSAAMQALKKGFGTKPVAIGCGGSIGFVGPLAELFGGAPALLLGIEDPQTNAHAPNESLHAGDFRKLTASLAHLFDNLGALPDGKVKAEPAAVAAPA